MVNVSLSIVWRDPGVRRRTKAITDPNSRGHCEKTLGFLTKETDLQGELPHWAGQVDQADVRCVAGTEEDGHRVSRHEMGTDRPFAGIQPASRGAESASCSAMKFTKLGGTCMPAVGLPSMLHMIQGQWPSTLAHKPVLSPAWKEFGDGPEGWEDHHLSL